MTVVVDVRLNHYRSMGFDLRCGNSRSKGPCNRIWFAQACRINSSFAALTKSLTNDGGRNENSSSPFTWRPITALDKKRRQPKQTAVIPIAIFHSNIDVRKEFKRITGSSRGKVKPLLPDNPYYSTNKSFNTRSFNMNHSPTTVIGGIFHHHSLGVGSTPPQRAHPKKLRKDIAPISPTTSTNGKYIDLVDSW